MRHSLHIRVHKNYKTYQDQAHTKERALFKRLLQTFHKTKPSIKTAFNRIIKITANTSQNVSFETHESVRPQRLFSTIPF